MPDEQDAVNFKKFLKLQKLLRQTEVLRRPIREEMERRDLIRAGEEKMGMGDNNIILKKGQVQINNENPAVGGKIGAEGSDLKFGKDLKTDLPIDHLKFEENKVLNPQIQYRPQNVVSYYPTVLTLPPTLLGGLLRGALALILQVVKKAREEENAG